MARHGETATHPARKYVRASGERARACVHCRRWWRKPRTPNGGNPHSLGPGNDCFEVPPLRRRATAGRTLLTATTQHDSGCIHSWTCSICRYCRGGRDADGLHQVTELSLNEKRVVIELNEAIVDKASYIDRLLSDGDCLEIIQFVPGG